MRPRTLRTTLLFTALSLLLPFTVYAQSRGFLAAPRVGAPAAQVASSQAADAGEAFALINADGDTLFVVDESGAVIAGAPGTFLGSGEGFVSHMTRPGGPSAGMFLTDNPQNQGINLYARTNGTGIAGYFAQVNDTTRSAAILAQTISMGAAGGFEIYNQENDYSAVFGLTRGLGPAGNFNIENEANNTPAVIGVTNGTGEAGFFRRSGNGSGYGPAVQVLQEGTAEFAPALHAQIQNSENNSPALEALTTGTGPAGNFMIENAASSAAALNASTAGTGMAGFFERNGSGSDFAPAVQVRQNGQADYAPALVAEMLNEENGDPAIEGVTRGLGPAGAFVNENASNGAPALVAITHSDGDIAHFNAGEDVRMRIDGAGNVFADGTFQGGGADLAEAFDVEGTVASYAPGDVLVISTRSDRTVERSQEPYSSLVAGVYATKPGVLLSEKGLQTDMSERVPMGVVGVLPTNVTLEGGPIRRGDLLVTSSTPGAAMKADPERVQVGQVLGKALEDFDGADYGRIKVLVSVQ